MLFAFKLIANRIARVIRGSYNDVNMIRAGVDCPNVPLAVVAVTAAFRLNDLFHWMPTLGAPKTIHSGLCGN